MNDDLDAIRRVLAADVESFRRLVERYQRPLLTLIRNLTPPDTDHEGVAQEVFLAAFRSLASFDPKRSAFSTWLFTIARNRCRNELARRRPVVGAELPDVVDLRSPERAASEAEGEGAGRDVFRAGRQPEQFARQPHDRLRGPWRRARRRTVQVLASRDVDPVRRPDRISTDLIPIMNPPLNGTSGPMHGGFSFREFRDKSLRYAEECPSHGLPVKDLPPGIALPEVLASWVYFSVLAIGLILV